MELFLLLCIMSLPMVVGGWTFVISQEVVEGKWNRK